MPQLSRPIGAVFVLVAGLLTAVPASATGEEDYYRLPRFKIVLPSGQLYLHYLLLDLALAVPPDERDNVRARQKDIEKEINGALASTPYERLAAAEGAETVKQVARDAARRVAGEGKVYDALIQHMSLR